MRVRVHRDEDPEVARPPGVDGAEVQALRVGVDLDRRALPLGGPEDRLEVDVVRLPLADQAPRRVGEDAHVRVRRGGAEAFGHLRPRLLEPRMHRADHEVEPGQHLVRVVQRAVGQDVALAPGEHGDARVLRLDGSDLRDVSGQLLRVEAAGDPRRGAVVRDRHVLVPARLRRRHERLDRVVAVGGVGVAVQVAAHVAELDEPRELAPRGGLDLARVLAQLGRDPRQADRGVDLLLGRPGHAPGARLAEHAVLVELEPAPDGHLADADVVLLGAGEVDEGGAEARRLDDAQVDLDPLPVPDRRLGLAALEHVGDLGQARERAHDLGRSRRRDQEVDVAHGLLPAAERAGERDGPDARGRLEGLHQRLPERQRAAERHPRLPAPDERDAPEDVRLGLRLDAVAPTELARARERLQPRDRRDPLLLVEEPGRPGPDARDAQQRDDAGRDALAGGVQVLHAPRRQVLGDPVGEVATDAGDLTESLLARQDLDVLGERLEVPRRAPVSADPEGVLAPELQDVRHEVEEARDLEVLHRQANAHR